MVKGVWKSDRLVVGRGVGGLDVRFVEEGAKWLDDGWWRRAMRKTKGNTIWISVTK